MESSEKLTNCPRQGCLNQIPADNNVCADCFMVYRHQYGIIKIDGSPVAYWCNERKRPVTQTDIEKEEAKPKKKDPGSAEFGHPI